MAELPYQAEYAKTGRASCKGCKEKIEQGSLRLAVMVQSAFFDGKQPNWFHENCFFLKQRPKDIADIANFNTLKNSDQKNIKSKIENSSGLVLPAEKKGKGKKRGTADSNASALKDFSIEYSKSSRATCRHCDIKICKDEVRICKVVFDTEVGIKYGGQPLWHHVKCFAEQRNELLYFAGGQDLPGFKNLKKEDQAIVKDAIKPLKQDEIPVKKLKEEPKDEQEEKEEKEKNKKLEKQNKQFQSHRKGLSELAKKDLDRLLEYNEQEVLSGKDKCLDHLADCMTFGALKPCPECDKGQLVLNTLSYKCTGDISEWTKCSYTTQNPERKALKIPTEFKEMPVFRKFKPKTDVRLFHAAPRPNVIVKDEPTTSVKKETVIPPLKNLQFFLYGKLKNKEEVKKRILKLGGNVVSKLSETIVAVVSTKKDVESNTAKMEDIQSKDIGVVEASFLDSIDSEKGTIAASLQIIKENNIADWGSDPTIRVSQDIIDGKSIPKSGSIYVKSSKSAVKLKIQGGTAVDPASELDHETHVYTDWSGAKYTVVLTQTDVVSQKNSFYKLQVLEHDTYKKYYLFRSWGRIGTTIGGNKVEKCSSLEDAMNKFHEIYLEKTENRWDRRNNFQKVPGRYYPLEVDYGDTQEESKALALDSKSKLAEAVQKLIMQIFDINNMKKTMLEFELDTEKMPLGKLSKNQIKSGYKVLSEIQKLIEKGKASQSKIIDATNRFFTLIPHDFGVNNPPLLDNAELIKSKTEMLDNLLEIEIAYTMLNADTDESVSPIESHYKKLKADIAPLDNSSSEFEMICEYVQNTHARTHSHYSLHVEQVFKVVREGEDKRYKPFKKLHNRRLLWHGSRVTNFAGILSQGLRIAPPEAPVTGYMFGKGIYFADMVSKSANYCCTSKINPVGLLLLCEVALGDMKECTKAENVKLPAGKHSAWGLGSTMPDPASDHVLSDGLIVPLGKPIQRDITTTLLYNEFIVYDVAQVNVKYLLQLKFDYKG
ncbi:poly [ADP-ribose] polymerase [Manduca sexta]|uniref:poly [ADP-ribose] polymerase n=1 Tax=Manduca sexta TaxID=7130 RepID=UPI00188DE8E8|nr:poly [ADP-ribose] polymerase [Manduca sexta]